MAKTLLAAALFALASGVRAGPLLSSIPVDIRLFNATYDGRFKANDVQTFNNELVVRQTLQGAQTIIQDALNRRPATPAPAATPKKKVRRYNCIQGPLFAPGTPRRANLPPGWQPSRAAASAMGRPTPTPQPNPALPPAPCALRSSRSSASTRWRPRR